MSRRIHAGGTPGGRVSVAAWWSPPPLLAGRTGGGSVYEAPCREVCSGFAFEGAPKRILQPRFRPSLHRRPRIGARLGCHDATCRQAGPSRAAMPRFEAGSRQWRGQGPSLRSWLMFVAPDEMVHGGAVYKKSAQRQVTFSIAKSCGRDSHMGTKFVNAWPQIIVE